MGKRYQVSSGLSLGNPSPLSPPEKKVESCEASSILRRMQLSSNPLLSQRSRHIKERKHPVVLSSGVTVSPHWQCPYITQAAKTTQEVSDHLQNKSLPFSCFQASPSSQQA